MLLEFSFESFILQRSPDAAQMDAHHLPELATLFPTDYKYHFTQHSLPRADYFYSDKIYNLFSLHPDSPSEKQQKHKDKKMRGEVRKNRRRRSCTSSEFLLSQNFHSMRQESKYLRAFLQPNREQRLNENIFFHRRWDMWSPAAISALSSEYLSSNLQISSENWTRCRKCARVCVHSGIGRFPMWIRSHTLF